MRAEVRTAATPEQVKREDEMARYRRERDIKDLGTVLSTVEGRRWMWRFLGNTGLNHGGFIQNGSEQYFLAGKRTVGLVLTSEVQTLYPDHYLLMQQEAIALQKMEAAALPSSVTE